jgi:hypothetical protein
LLNEGDEIALFAEESFGLTASGDVAEEDDDALV